MSCVFLNRFVSVAVVSAAVAATCDLDSCAGECAKLADSVVELQALTIDGKYGQSINGKSFQQDAVTTHGGWQYVAYYDADRHVAVARRRLPDGGWRVFRFQDYDFRGNDAHNTISMGICPADGTIHLAFDHHGNPLHYRVSRKGAATAPQDVEWDASLFGPILSCLEGAEPIRITYPRFIQTPDGGLQFCYRRGRSGRGDRMLVDYDPSSGAWRNTRQIDSGKGDFSDGVRDDSGSRCSYPNGYGYGPDERLHVTWVWREDSQWANHDLMYAYSDDRGATWKNNDGQALDAPPRVDSPGIRVVAISRAHGLMNTHGQAVDSQGRVHSVVWHCTDDTLGAGPDRSSLRWGPVEARRYHHYWRSVDGAWRHVELPGAAGGRPKLFVDRDDNAILIFNDSPVPGNVRPDGGDLKIMAATAESEWTDWRVVHTERGPFVNEMLGDVARWKDDGVLSVLVQDLPPERHAPSRLRILDFAFNLGSESR